jgi:multidrug transporter EmrE-like cation transporter
MQQTIISYLLLPVWCFLGVLVSYYIKKHHWAWILSIPISIPTTFSWSIIVRNNVLPLSIASGIYDTIITVSYVIIFILFGEQITFTQVIGVLLAVFGIILMSIK